MHESIIRRACIGTAPARAFYFGIKRFKAYTLGLSAMVSERPTPGIDHTEMVAAKQSLPTRGVIDYRRCAIRTSINSQLRLPTRPACRGACVDRHPPTLPCAPAKLARQSIAYPRQDVQAP